MRIGVLSNLRAGRGGPRMERLEALLRTRPDIAHVETRSAKELPLALGQLERAGVDLIAIHGGDGTLQRALTALLADPRRQRIPAIAPLRGGRTNMIATDLGAARDPVSGLGNLLEAVDCGYVERLAVERPVLRVRSPRRGADQYGLFFGAGLIHRAIGLVHRTFPPGQQGLLGAGAVTAALVSKMLFKPTRGILTPDKCTVIVDGRELIDAELYLMLASSLTRLFLRMNPFWGGGPGGIRLTAIESRAQALSRAALPVLAGWARPSLVPERGYTSVRTERAQLRISCGFTIDGELFDPEPEETLELACDRRTTFLRA